MRGYLIALTAACMLSALLRSLAPENGTGRVVRLGAGLLVLLAALGPLVELDTVAAAEQLVQALFTERTQEKDFSEDYDAMLSSLISEEAETYILDKAEELGLRLRVEVTTAVEDDTVVFRQVRLYGDPTPQQKARMTELLTEELGIDPERQEWWSM